MRAVIFLRFPILKHLLPLIAVILCSLSSPLHAAKKSISVLILPFEINAAADLMYLQSDIPKALRGHLEPEGATILEFPEQYTPPIKDLDLDESSARQAGIQSGADVVIWGSMTWIGQQFSLDIRLLDIFEGETPKVFTVAGRGLENLPVKVEELADEVILEIFELSVIAEIRIEGTQRIEADAIRKLIKSKPGDIYSVKSLSEDLKSVFAMGYFDDVRIEAEDRPQGREIIFTVKEKPTIRYINVDGAKPAYDADEIKENLTINTGSILNINQIQNNIQRIEELYKEKNYHNVKVEYSVTKTENNQADLKFEIEEGDKVLILEIAFIGNKAFPDKRLKKEMKTSEKGFLHWIMQTGELNKEDLEQDTGALEAFYHNNGFIRAKVGEPQVEFKEDGIYVTIKINEGPRFKVGKFDIQGDLIFPKEVLVEMSNLRKEEFYNRTTLRNDILAISDMYGDEGYAYVDIAPIVNENQEQLLVDITYRIDKRQQVYVEEIIIAGNTRTRDKVIRRQIQVHEQGLFSGTKLKRSVRNLHRLDYFEDVKVNTVKGSQPDKMVLKIDVKEKSTGQISFGGGYSNSEGFFVVGSIAERNLWGRGWIVDVKGELGGRTTRFSVGFTEPWLFDIPLTAGGRIYNWAREFDAYDRESRGGSIFFGYPIFKDTRINLGFTTDIANIEVTEPENVPDSIQELVDIFGSGDIVTNSINTSLNYDTRDRIFSPTSGSNHRISVEYAGLGGDIGYTKLTGNLSHYFPLPWRFVFFARGRAGYVYENSGFVLPDYEKFFLGGMNSIRGYDEDEIQPRDSDGNVIGGDRFVQANFELSHPLYEPAGLDGVLFIDNAAIADPEAADPAQQSISSDSLRHSYGIEVRWNSPMGPLRFAYAWKVDPQPGEDPSGFEFSMGAAF